MKIRMWLQPTIEKELIHYDVYDLTLLEKLKYTLLGMGSLYIMGILFYNHHVIALVLSFLGLLYPRIKKPDLIKKRKAHLKSQFKEMIYALSSSLGAGRSIESAFRVVLDDLQILYPDPNTYIIKELEYIVRRIEMNETIEDAIEDFATRSAIDDIENFSRVFTTAKRTGGNIIRIIAYTTRTISEKMEIKSEIEVLVTSKQFEHKILSLLIPLMIVYLQLSSPGYIDVMYTTALGRVLMTMSLLLFMVSYKIGQKITDIEV